MQASEPRLIVDTPFGSKVLVFEATLRQQGRTRDQKRYLQTIEGRARFIVRTTETEKRL